ncbi:putative L-threonylcarbamoyladenylate synthase [Microsporum canis]|uniref:Threonylcarbamoyl-AMP synthase n=1 Tax=Arthroderma otae (strain ATCC MYA-4605 / CBS 113480) TaxID=554155 RepID=C5FP20_ARTOC|nr:translation initiation protein Sua5 [Microsporum canis CBS 113480]EEQ31873.1 translation initiation protein Sua5 [Microsporum canis CBS 113480]
MPEKIDQEGAGRVTRILPVHRFADCSPGQDILAKWAGQVKQEGPEVTALLEAAEAIRTSDVPVAFPTETVYGLGADATRSAAVQGIYKAKQRPSDNPLIVHVSSREQLERLLQTSQPSNGAIHNPTASPIPKIYEPVIEKFWPGALSIILPNPSHLPLAPEVTASLSTFAVRMPSSPLARLLIALADRPVAAPSANASTKPSPTTAQHVYTDLQGRIDIILDGGPCGVGVESTVVDGLSSPPAILRPGGVGIDELRTCPGWENVQIGYKDGALQGKATPRAPGMKYKHYSPKARVVLFEAGQDISFVTNRIITDINKRSEPGNDATFFSSIGIIRTKTWKKGLGISQPPPNDANGEVAPSTINSPADIPITCNEISSTSQITHMFDIYLGDDTSSIARGLFSALRSLDERNVSVIYIEGISDTEGDLAAAVMNRLRKAAEEEVKVSQ